MLYKETPPYTIEYNGETGWYRIVVNATRGDVERATLYINSLRRADKIQYAKSYLSYLVGQADTEPIAPKTMNYMSAQAVRMRLRSLGFRQTQTGEWFDRNQIAVMHTLELNLIAFSDQFVYDRDVVCKLAYLQNDVVVI